jgi:hypothetical protein
MPTGTGAAGTQAPQGEPYARAPAARHHRGQWLSLLQGSSPGARKDGLPAPRVPNNRRREWLSCPRVAPHRQKGWISRLHGSSTVVRKDGLPLQMEVHPLSGRMAYLSKWRLTHCQEGWFTSPNRGSPTVRKDGLPIFMELIRPLDRERRPSSRFIIYPHYAAEQSKKRRGSL